MWPCYLLWASAPTRQVTFVSAKVTKTIPPGIPRLLEIEWKTIQFQARFLAARVLGAALTAHPCVDRADGAIPCPVPSAKGYSLRALRGSALSTGNQEMPTFMRERSFSSLHLKPPERRRALDQVRIRPRSGRSHGWRAFAAAGMYRLRRPEGGKEGSAQGTAAGGGVLGARFFRPLSLRGLRKGPIVRGRNPVILNNSRPRAAQN